MTPGEIALFIFAIAFLALVLFIGMFLMRATQSLKVITSDVDVIVHSSNEILANANTLLNDVNGKVKTIDPTFQAMADLSVTVSQLNASVQNVTNRFSSSKMAASAGASGMAAAAAQTVAKSAVKRFKKRNKKNRDQA